MELDLVGLIRSRPELLLFVIVGLGFLVGRIGIRGTTLGSSIGVLFVALFFGRHGFELHPIIGTLGFIFFIYSVGFQAGPRFFASFRADGIRFVQIGLVIAASAVGTVLLAAMVCDFEPGYAAGVLAGALTSTPTLAAAQDAIASGLARLPDGYDPARADANVAVAYAVTYIFGLVGLILALKILPRMIGVDLERESKAMESSDDGPDADDEMGLGRQGMPSLRVYEVRRDEVDGKSLDELKVLQNTGVVICQLRRAGENVALGPDTVLKRGDRLSALGYRQSQIRAARVFGEEVEDAELERSPVETHQIQVSSATVIGKTLRQAGVTNKFACITNRISRGGVEIPVSLDMRLQRGDFLVVSGTKDRIEALVPYLGHAETPIHETDLLTFAFGIALGLMVGFTTIKFGKLPLGIGTAGGLLAVGLVIGWARTVHPAFGRVPQAARYILMELGLLLFLAGVGVRAGSGLVAGLKEAGLPLFLSGVAVTLVPILVGVAYGRFVLKMNPAILFGAMCGGLTSTPALGVVTAQARSGVPALGYAGVYAFGNIILTVVGQVMMLL